MNNICQVSHCGKQATFHSFPANAAHPDENGMQTCDAHLSEGMSNLMGQPTPEHWRVFPLQSDNAPGVMVDPPKWELVVDDREHSVCRVPVPTGWIYQIQNGRGYHCAPGTIGRGNDSDVPIWGPLVFVPKVP